MAFASQSPVVAALVSSSFVVSGTPSFVVLSNCRPPACLLSFVWFCGLVRWSVLSRAVRGMLPMSDASITVRSFVTSGCVRSSRWLRRISAAASALVRPVSATHSCQLEVPFCRSVLSSLFSRAWSVALLLDYSVCSFVRFPSVLLVWSVVSSVRRPISVVSFLVAKRESRNAKDVILNHGNPGPDSRACRRNGRKRSLQPFHQGNRATLEHHSGTADAYLMQIGDAKI